MTAPLHRWDKHWIKAGVLYLILHLMGIALPPASPASAAQGWILRDYPIALTLPRRQLEAGLAYQMINDTIDLFGVKAEEYDKLSSADRATAPGDLWGARLLLNYGLFRRTTLMSTFDYRNQDYGYDSLDIRTFDLSLKQGLIDNDKRRWRLALVAGVCFNSAGEAGYDNQTEINAIIRRIAPDTPVSIRIDPNFVWFDQTSEGGDQVSLGVRRQGRPDPKVTIDDMQDLSTYMRLTGGWDLGRFFPNLFVEAGHTEIETIVDTTLTEYVPADFQDRMPAFPKDLSRSENYVKAGLGLHLKLTRNLSVVLAYHHLKLYRDEGLDYMDNNNIYKVDVNYQVTPALVINMGGIYFHRQLNGEIPFLYNQFTQTTFDHPYGYAHMGLTYFFNLR